MLVRCVLCDKESYLDDRSYESKRLLNHPLATYMCEECKERIALRTKQRLQERAKSQSKKKGLC